MTTVATSSSIRNETPLQKEQRTFNDLFFRLIDALLNRMFDLRPRAASGRLKYLIFLFFLTIFLISLIHYPLTVWAMYIRDIFTYLFNSSIPQNFPGNPFYNIANYAVEAFTDPRTLQYLPIFLAPFFIALQTAANYLADIFELSDPTVARAFVWAVSLTGSNETIRIKQGNIDENYKASPTYLIGGPGRVIVDMDSAALFEKPDGTTRVIGPTGSEPGGRAQLDGFERFRQAIDLRDHYIELRDEEGISAVVRGRSLDGIPITASDVNFVFSVHRGGQKSGTAHPYPFSPKAVEQLVYKSTSRVTPDLTNPSTFEFSWINNMVSLVRGRLSNFMNNHKLTEYLASIGQPELDRFQQRETEIAEVKKGLGSTSDDDVQDELDIKPSSEFKPRYKILKDLFNQFAEEFSSVAFSRGVELHWIGVGTWKTPVEIIPEKHREAWLISRENLDKESDMVTRRWFKEATVQKFIALIQDVPIAKYQSVIQQYEHYHAIRAMLEAYRQQLIELADFLKSKGDPVPAVMIRAIKHLNDVLGFKDWHWVGTVEREEEVPPSNGSSGSPAAIPVDWQRPVEFMYQELVQLVGGDQVAADRLIEAERRQYPKETLRQLIERTVQRYLRERR
jgi:hypothetical protein